jgi:hypothetical protein
MFKERFNTTRANVEFAMLRRLASTMLGPECGFTDQSHVPSVPRGVVFADTKTGNLRIEMDSDESRLPSLQHAEEIAHAQKLEVHSATVDGHSLSIVYGDLFHALTFLKQVRPCELIFDEMRDPEIDPLDRARHQALYGVSKTQTASRLNAAVQEDADVHLVHVLLNSAEEGLKRGDFTQAANALTEVLNDLGAISAERAAPLRAQLELLCARHLARPKHKLTPDAEPVIAVAVELRHRFAELVGKQ